MRRIGMATMRRNPGSLGPGARVGAVTPGVVAGLLLALCGFALVLDYVWLETARLELTTTAEAAALAAAHRLASDDLLIPGSDVQQRMDVARTEAIAIASENHVVGQPVQLLDQDVRFGVLQWNQSVATWQFVEDDTAPQTVLVTATRARSRANPIGLFLAGLTGQPVGDVVTRAEATVNNRVIGVRPFQGGRVPALPLAIWKVDPAGKRTDTWQEQIVNGRGTDKFHFDETTQSVQEGGDGIPEMRLHSLRTGGLPSDVNMQLLDLGTGFDAEQLVKQIESGWSVTDLAEWDGQLCLGPTAADSPASAGSSSSTTGTNGNNEAGNGGTSPASGSATSAGSASPTNTNSATANLRSTAELKSEERDALTKIIGQTRIVPLYVSAVSVNSAVNSQQTTQCVEFVAVRVLAVNDQPDGSCELVVQPTVMATRTVLVVDSSQSVPAHKYLYKLSLTQ